MIAVGVQPPLVELEELELLDEEELDELEELLDEELELLLDEELVLPEPTQLGAIKLPS